MKIVLANSIPPENFTRHYLDTSYPCLGLLYLAGSLKRNYPDINIKYVEADYTIDSLLNMLRSFRPEIFGLYIPTDVSQMSYKIMNAVKKEFPSIFVIAGGPHPSALPEEVLKESHADICCIGEGEITMSQIVEHRTNGNAMLKDIQGIAYRNGNSIKFTDKRSYIEDLDSISWPLWDLVEINKYKGRQFKKAKTTASVLASRGCPFNCSFCSNPVWKTNKPWVRMRKPLHIAEEIDYLYKKGARDIYLRADELNCNVKWAIQVCQEISKLRLKDLYLSVNLRVDKVPVELANALRDANFWIAYLGVESANDRVLKGVGKNITVDNAITAFKNLKKAGINVYANFMLFNIWEEDGRLQHETPEEVLETYKFVKQCIKNRLIDYIAWSITAPYPGSRLWELEEKFHFMREDRFKRCSLQTTTVLPGLQEKEVIKLRRKFQILQAYLALKSGNFEWRYFGRMVDRIKYLFWT